MFLVETGERACLRIPSAVVELARISEVIHDATTPAEPPTGLALATNTE